MFSQTNAFALAYAGGRIRVDTATLSPGGLRVSRVVSTGHLVDLSEENAATLLLPSSGQLRVRVAAADYRIASKSICIFGPNARRTRAEAPASSGLFQANALMIPNKALRELVHASRDQDAMWSGLPDGLPVSPKLHVSRQLSDFLMYITRQFDDGFFLSAKAGAAMAVLIEELLSKLILQSVPVLAEDRAVPAAWLRVRMAEEIMRARSDEPLSMAEVAREVGVGLRSLQLAFMEARAMGPRDVLTRIRLERARDRLLKPNPTDTVTSIALDCGFAHLGRFPGAYRVAYGELPTETLLRARRRLI